MRCPPMCWREPPQISADEEDLGFSVKVQTAERNREPSHTLHDMPLANPWASSDHYFVHRCVRCRSSKCRRRMKWRGSLTGYRLPAYFAIANCHRIRAEQRFVIPKLAVVALLPLHAVLQRPVARSIIVPSLSLLTPLLEGIIYCPLQAKRDLSIELPFAPPRHLC